MTVATFLQPNMSTQLGSTYKAAIDAAIAVLVRQAGAFAPHEQNVGSPAPDLSMRVDAGSVWSGSALTEVAAQTVSGFTTPASGYVRIDRVVVDAVTGVASRVAGTAQTAGSPTALAPSIPAGKVPVCQIAFTSASTVITNSMITDERVFPAAPAGLTLLQAQIISSPVAAVDFVTGLDSTYDNYVLLISDLIPATDAINLFLRVSEDGGGTFKSGASDYAWNANGVGDGGASTAGSTGDTGIRLNHGNTLSNSRAYGGEVLIHSPSGAALHKLFTSRGSYEFSGGTMAHFVGGGVFKLDTNAINGIRILSSSGNISSGKLALYGVRKS